MDPAFQAVAIALAIGLLVGAERERDAAHRPGQAGVRTFALAALAGCVAALVGPVVLGLVALGAAVVMAAGYLRLDSGPDRARAGTTTEVALVLTVLLGGLTVAHAALAVAAAVASAVLLLARDRVHHFVRETISEVEVADGLKFFVAAFIVLPLVPSTSIGPYGSIDPRRVWTLVVAVTAIGWVGHVAVRIFGTRRGLPVAGLAGGFVSSTATTASMARTARDPALARSALAAALLATVGSLAELVVITTVASPRVAQALALPVVAGMVVLIGETWWLLHREALGGSPGAGSAPASRASGSASRRPFALVPALVLAAIITLLLVVAEAASRHLGPGGVVAAIGLAGLADSHAAALTAATLAGRGSLAAGTAVLATMAAVGLNTITKIGIAFVTGGREVGARLAALFAAPVAAVALTLFLT